MPFKLKNISGAELVALAKPGHPDSMVVAVDAVIEIPGGLAKEQPEDAYLTDGDDPRAWPHAVWELIEDKPATKATSVKEQ